MKCDILIKAFTSQVQTGSPQHLHFFKTESEMNKAAESIVITDNFDHSFVYLDSKDKVIVTWKNKAGTIQCCGSAAYSLAWLLIKTGNTNKLSINSKHYELSAYLDKEGPILELPKRLPINIKKTTDNCLYVDKPTGIYLLEINEAVQLKNDSWVKDYLEKEQLEDIHGFCIFYWNKEKRKGKLRYFTPWHGRDEDYVTGSIHQYLSPLIQAKYLASQQEWHQLSTNPGVIFTKCTTQTVKLIGKCSLE
jgi:predicted PhzF superfamily epimerase YddE/YHI9